MLLGCGKNSARDLWNSTVSIIGCGGTGSPIAHVLARAGVGKIILIDFDHLSWSNSERVHGANDWHLKMPLPPTKAKVLYDLIEAINPDVEVAIHHGSVHDARAQELIASSDFIFGCTDTHNGRAGVADAANRFLLPAIHVNVSMEPAQDSVGAEIIHITQYGPTLACPYCRDQIDGRRVFQELMSPDERAARKDQAENAKRAGKKPDAYWTDEPVVATVGSLTTTAGGLASNYAIGILTGKYQLPATFLEINLLAADLGVVLVPINQRHSCMCLNAEGGAVQIERLIKTLEPSGI